jgi:hypothetical protein
MNGVNNLAGRYKKIYDPEKRIIVLKEYIYGFGKKLRHLKSFCRP